MKKALIIDDTKNIRLMLTKCMEIEGYEIEAAENGKIGLEMAAEKKYDLIFLDIKLPEISGTEVLRRLRAEGVTTPIIVITAYPTVKNAVDCTQLGAIAYLQKPFTMERIKNMLNDLDLKSEVFAKESILEIVNELIDYKNYEAAIDELKAALAKEPLNSKIYGLLGKAYSLMGEKEISEKFYKAEEIFK